MSLELNKIYHADCLDLMREIPDKSIDLVLTDIPYGINYLKTQRSMYEKNRISNGGKWKKYDLKDWDNEIPTPHYFEQIFRVSKIQVIWGGNYTTLPAFGQWLIWNKIQRGYMTDGEMAWTNQRGACRIFDYARADAYINDIDIKIHPTQKPVKLFEWILNNYSEEGQTILDPFSGSGTTAIACHNLNRNFICIEKDKDYHEKSVKRYEEHIKQMRLAI